MKIRLSLSIKIIALFLLFISATGFLIYFTVSKAIVQGSIEITIQSLSKLIGGLSEKIESNDLFDKYDQIAKLFKTTIESRAIIEELFFVQNNRIVVSIDPDKVGKPVGEGHEKRGKMIIQSIETGKPASEIEERTDIMPRYTYVYPVKRENKVEGVIVCKYSLEREFHAVNHAREALLKYTLIATLVYVPIMLLILNFIIIQPLKRIVRAAKMLGEGKFSLDLNIKTHDELQTVSETFILTADKIRATYERYLSPQVVEEISNDPELLNLGGIKTSATVMFVDLANFTLFSQISNTKTITSFLNNYLETMTEIIFRYNGTLDKYIGDGILAVFGTPKKDENYTINAFNAALEMVDEFSKKINLWLEQAEAPSDYSTNIRIGLSSGEVFSGNIGYERRMDFTVIGEAVNLASRLEKVNKRYGTNILMDDPTYNSIKHLNLKLAFSGEVNIRGYEEKVKVYGIKIIKLHPFR